MPGGEENAIEHWEKVLAEQPINEEAVSALEALYQKAGHFDKLKAFLEEQ